MWNEEVTNTVYYFLCHCFDTAIFWHNQRSTATCGHLYIAVEDKAGDFNVLEVSPNALEQFPKMQNFFVVQKCNWLVLRLTLNIYCSLLFLENLRTWIRSGRSSENKLYCFAIDWWVLIWFVTEECQRLWFQLELQQITSGPLPNLSRVG